MDIQTILVIALFAAALFYIGRMVYRTVFVKSGSCGSNCKCGVDFSTIKTEKK